MNSTDNNSPKPAPQDIFATTRWTVVLSAGQKSSPHSDRALAELCQTYWYPLYAWVRRQGHTREDAEDLVQAFFARFLESLAWAYFDCQETCPAVGPGAGWPEEPTGGPGPARLWLAAAARTALRAGLGRLGVDAPDRL